MTALTAGLALIPLAIAGDLPGNEIQSPMAKVILGGLLTSTLLNIFYCSCGVLFIQFKIRSKMKNITYIILPFLILAIKVNGQTSIDSVLADIARNNKTIIANTKYWEAKTLEYQTG